ncbi:MAG: Crp/Fnr family transcriptional regulator [Gemmiger sp.]
MTVREEHDEPISAEQFNLPDYPSRIFRQRPGWERFLTLGDHVYFGKNKLLVEAGQPVRWCYLVVEGRVISKEYTPEGTEHIYNFFEDGSLFLESNVLLDAPAAVCFQTMAPCDLVRISKKALLDAMDGDREITRFVLESISYKYYSAMDQLRENYDHDATWKLYNMLLIMADNFGELRDNGWVRIRLKISQQMLSSLLGVNRVTVCKVLKEMKEMRLIEQVNGYYCIRNTKMMG